jgi:hypothetical protein
MDYSGAIYLKRVDGIQRASIDLSYAPSLAAIETFAAAAYPMTTAKIARISFIESNDLTSFPGLSEEIYDLEYAAHFKFRRLNPTNDVYFRNFRLPAPRMEIFELIENTGYRIKTSYGETMATALSTLWGDPVQFDSGWLVH